MAVFIILFISALMITIEAMRLSDLEMITNHIEDLEAYYCAEAGAEYGIWWSRGSGLSITRQRQRGPRTLACTNGGSITNTGWTFTTTYQTQRGDPNINLFNKIHILAIGNTDAFTRRVEVQVHRPSYGGRRRIRQIRRWRDL